MAENRNLQVHIDLTSKVKCGWFSYSHRNKYQSEETQMVKVLNFSLKDIKKQTNKLQHQENNMKNKLNW